MSTQTARDFMDEKADWMRRARKRLGLSQVQVAQALGCSDSTYSDYERGITMINAHSLRALEQYFSRQHQIRGVRPRRKALD